MFGVDFFELAVIFTVALIVLGPTRLPGLVRKVGRWVGKARNMARQFRDQLENEINVDELHRMTDARAREAAASTPAPPPELSGEPIPPAAEQPTQDSSLAASGYPYGPPEPVPPTGPNPTDDTFSHAHNAGAAPMPWEPEVVVDAAPEATVASASPDSPKTSSPAA
jgi:sec-independent protein translocase protein TatB